MTFRFDLGSRPLRPDEVPVVEAALIAMPLDQQPSTDSVTVDGVNIPGGKRVIQGAAVGNLAIKRLAKIRVKLVVQP